MKPGQQGGPSPARSHIAPAKISDHRDAGHLGERIGIADRPREGSAQVRAMTQRLSVTADGAYAIGADSRASHQRQCGLGKRHPKLDIDLPYLIESCAVGLIDERRDPALATWVDRRGAAGKDAYPCY